MHLQADVIFIKAESDPFLVTHAPTAGGFRGDLFPPTATLIDR